MSNGTPFPSIAYVFVDVMPPPVLQALQALGEPPVHFAAATNGGAFVVMVGNSDGAVRQAIQKDIKNQPGVAGVTVTWSAQTSGPLVLRWV